MDFKGWALLILTLVYLYGMFLKWIEKRSENNPVPPNVIDVYDRDTYRTWRRYHGEKCRLSMIEKTAAFVIDFLLIALNLYASFAALFPDTPFWQMAGVLLLSALTSLLLLPVSYWDTMKIEEKYGFNRSTKKTFWLDQAKSFLIQLVILIVVGSLLMWVHKALGDWMILAFAVLMTLIVLFIAFLYPHLSKIFNKFTPLEDGELKEKLTALLEKNGYRAREIQVMDASRRSTKSNAYFSGFGKMKTIVLYDTLLKASTPDEICAVFAHELGHGLHKDTLKNQLMSFAQMAVLGVLAWLTLRSAEIFAPFGFSGVNYGFAMILIMSVEFALVQPLFGLAVNALSRRAEYRADQQAVREGYGPALISALKKLARQNFSALAPSPLLVKLEYSHPTLSQRIKAIEKQG
ncbi:MAG: M48 family metallopeptidase [Clostridia bacterium]|nr:M48 family metallopeptidase [Clostridia bacterium]MBR6186715.1 M48 family metallopeptidase [Clostridia bacterium]